MFGSSPIELLAADAMLRGAINCNAYTYNADFLTGTSSAIPANATPVNVPIQITSEADFVVQQATFTVYGTDVNTILADPDYTLNIAISSGRPWFNAPSLIRNFCGTWSAAEFVRSLPFPRLIPLNSTLTVTVVNRTANAANFAQLLLTGFNVYYRTETRQQVFHAL
jgi:hypothetical protein